MRAFAKSMETIAAAPAFVDRIALRERSCASSVVPIGASKVSWIELTCPKRVANLRDDFEIHLAELRKNQWRRVDGCCLRGGGGRTSLRSGGLCGLADGCRLVVARRRGGEGGFPDGIAASELVGIVEGSRAAVHKSA